MISVDQAKELIKAHTALLAPKQFSLLDALGLVLAEDIYAQVNIPAFPQSSMDGYAFRYADWQSDQALKVEGMVPAGVPMEKGIRPHTATRIFTGAAVPPGADTIVMQEKIVLKDGSLIIQDGELQPGSNVRPAGSEIRLGDLALEKGNRLSAAAIGFLAGIGVDTVSAYPMPVVSLIVTGDELEEPGRPLRYGQVYESNSFTLRSALSRCRINDPFLYRVADDPETLLETLAVALEKSDLILLTGGISAGDFDFVAGTAEKLGVEKIFHQVKQRPGKPLFFGKHHGKIIFGLPGNPASVLSCFYQYVLLALSRMAGADLRLKCAKAPLGKTVEKKAALTFFLKGYFDGKTAMPLEAQESYRMYSYARANCLIQLPEAPGNYPEGEPVMLYLIE